MLSYEGEQFDVISVFMDLQSLVRDRQRKHNSWTLCIFSSGIRTNPEDPVNNSIAGLLEMFTNCSMMSIVTVPDVWELVPMILPVLLVVS